MKKLILALAIAMLATPALAGYDTDLVNMQSVDLTDPALVDSTDYIKTWDTAGESYRFIDAERIKGLGAPIVTVTGTTAADCATNGTSKVNYISSAVSNATITLPAATGSGCEYEFVWLAAPTGSGDVIQVTGDDSFNGFFHMAQDSGDTSVVFETASDTDKLTFTSSTRGVAQAGATVKFVDAAADKWVIQNARLIGTGTEATPGATAQRP